MLDTSPLYSLSDQADSEHTRAKAGFAYLAQIQAEIRIPLPCLLEFHRLRLYRKPFLPGKASGELLRLVAAFPVEYPTSEDLKLALNTLPKHMGQKITLADALVAAMCQRLGCRVFTFDADFWTLEVEVLDL